MKEVKIVSMPEAPQVHAVETTETVYVNASNDAVKCYGIYAEFDEEPTPRDISDAVGRMLCKMQGVIRLYPHLDKSSVIYKEPSELAPEIREWTVALKLVFSGQPSSEPQPGKDCSHYPLVYKGHVLVRE